MALHDPAITVNGVVESQERLFTITLHLEIPDDDPDFDGIDERFSLQIRTDGAQDPEPIKEKVVFQMQEAINRYNHAKNIAKSPALDNAVTDILSKLEV